MPAPTLTPLFPPRATKRAVSEPEPWVDIHAVAKHCGVTVAWLYESGDRDGFPCTRLGRQRRYRLSDVDAFLLARSVAA